MAAWKGNGPVQTTRGGEVRDGIFNVSGGYIDAVPPTFLLEFQNRSRQAIQISALHLEVANSETDNQPAIQMVDLADDLCGGSFSTDYDLENYGWSPAKNARLRFSFTRTAAPAPADGQVTKPIGDLSGRKRINLEPELQRFGVNVPGLKRLSNAGFRCRGNPNNCLETLRSNSLFGTLGSRLALNNLQIIVRASGSLDYEWKDIRGADHNRSSPFSVMVGLGKIVQEAECGEGGGPQPPRTSSLRLQLDATNYTVPVPFQRSIAAGQTARVPVSVSAAKSSNHALRIVAVLADGRTVSSLPIQLLYFRPHEITDQR